MCIFGKFSSVCKLPRSVLRLSKQNIQMGRARNKQQRGGGRRHDRKRDDKLATHDDGRVDHRAQKENPAFAKYYKELGIVPDGEWDDFYAALKDFLPVTFRISGHRQQAEALMDIIKSDYFSQLTGQTVGDIEVQPPKCLPWYPDELAWQLNLSRKDIRAHPLLQKLHSFLVTETESGNISRQEAVSMIPPLVMDIQSHHKVLDMCAAPGSKTAQLIEYLHSDESNLVPEGFVVANDSANKRCYLMVHQVKRLQSPCFMIVNHDAIMLPNMWLSHPEDEQREFVLYDRILADVPCSGDGTIRKNPDLWIKWRPTTGMNLHGLQFKILKRGVELLAVGGRIVYSTCSLNPMEDEAVVTAMLQKSEGALQLVDVADKLPGLKYTAGIKSWRIMGRNEEWYSSWEEVPPNYQSQIRPTMFPAPPEVAETLNLHRCMRILPHQQNTGGFFVAVLEKTRQVPWKKCRAQTVQGKLSDAELSKETNGGINTSSTPVLKTEESDGVRDTTAAEHDLRDTTPAGPELDAEIGQLTQGSDEGTEPEIATVGDAAGSGDASAEKRKAEPQGPPNKKKKIWGCYKEDPFLFLDTTDREWAPIQSFFSLSPEFPTEQLMYRCETGKKRTLYFVSKAIKRLAECNSERVKFINMGVKAFGRNPSPLVPECDYRIGQEGVDSLHPYLSHRTVMLEREDVITLLSEESPFCDKLQPKTQIQIENMPLGSSLYHYTPLDKTSKPNCEIMMCGWRGKTSVRCFVTKNDRSHFLRLCGLEPSLYGKTEESNGDTKQTADCVMADDNKPSDINPDDSTAVCADTPHPQCDKNVPVTMETGAADDDVIDKVTDVDVKMEQVSDCDTNVPVTIEMSGADDGAVGKVNDSLTKADCEPSS